MFNTNIHCDRSKHIHSISFNINHLFISLSFACKAHGQAIGWPQASMAFATARAKKRLLVKVFKLVEQGSIKVEEKY